MKTIITRAELKQLLEGHNKVILIDVHSEAEYAEKHIPSAVNLPIEKIEAGKLDLDLRKTIVTACGKGGGRSAYAAKHIRENYIADVYFLEGGTFGWFENEN